VTGVDPVTAARVLGVPVDATPAEVDASYRARVRERHPDRFLADTVEWRWATRAMQELNDARSTLAAGGSHAVRRAADAPGAAQPAPPWERATVGPADELHAYRVTRLRGLVWGAFLLVAAVGGYLIGAARPTNDALPLWSPSLAVIGLASLALGLRADRRLRAARRGAPSAPGGSAGGPL
jgi:hypothetical protein